MGIFDRFPYSSTHEMNLDFMLGKATEIAESLQEIDTHKEQAEQAAQAAQAAQTAAQAAQTAAQAAQTAAGTSASQAAQHKADAEDAADRAEAASDLADEAVEQAQAAVTQAQTAATNASTAADGAIASANAAETRINTLAASLPEDFTELNNKVTDLKSAFETGLNARLDAENSIQKYEIGIDLLTNATYFPRSMDYFVENGNHITLKEFTTGSNYVAINIPVNQYTDYRIAFFNTMELQFAKYAFLTNPISAPTNNIGTTFTDPVIVNSQGNSNLILIFQILNTNPDTDIEFSVYPASETILQTVKKGYAPIENINMFNKSNVTTGNYVRYDNGNLATGANYSATEFIPVTPGERYTINIGTAVGVQQMAWYKADKTYLSGLPNTGINLQTTVIAPANAAYMRWTIINANIDTTQIQKGDAFTGYVEYGVKKIPAKYIPETGSVVYVGTGKQYTSILRALKETNDDVEIHVLEGAYDLLADYTNYYGNDFWTNYTGYDGITDNFYRGLWISNGRKITFDPKAILTFNNTSENTNITSKFSIFATGYNATIDGANVVYSGVRYAIHDDFASVAGTNIFRNCIFDGTPYSNAVIGAGIGTDNTYIIENCIFRNNTGVHDISYHGSTAGTSAKCKIIIKNCYGSKRCAFRWYGASQEITECEVSSCHFGEIICHAYDSSQQYENMRLYSFCNETA